MLGSFVVRYRAIFCFNKTTLSPFLRTRFLTGFSKPTPGSSPSSESKCGTPMPDDDSDEDYEEMFVTGPAGLEWGGPTRGGRRPEPTRYGDWERLGRVSDF